MSKRTVSKRIKVEQTGHTVAICGVKQFSEAERVRLNGFYPNRYDRFYTGRNADENGPVLFYLARTLSEHRKTSFEMYHVWYRDGTMFRSYGYDMNDAIKKAANHAFTHFLTGITNDPDDKQGELQPEWTATAIECINHCINDGRGVASVTTKDSEAFASFQMWGFEICLCKSGRWFLGDTSGG